MGRRRITRGARIAINVEGIFGEIDDKAAIDRAQKKNARVVERRVKELAEEEVEHKVRNWIDTLPRNRDQYPGEMAQYYTARVDSNGDVILDNPTARASWFEYGTAGHSIEASGWARGGRKRPARGKRGTFTRGAQVLRFPAPGGGVIFAGTVDHPGQSANPIMLRAMEESASIFADNLADELVEAF